ncbi:hypothetical protein MMC21_003629 [Puttea exsequens]|nr:hypothetical protein [Puttea exsequens]
MKNNWTVPKEWHKMTRQQDDLAFNITKFEDQEPEPAVELLVWHSRAMIGGFLPMEILDMIIGQMAPANSRYVYDAIFLGVVLGK